jgi:hypothetical protein
MLAAPYNFPTKGINLFMHHIPKKIAEGVAWGWGGKGNLKIEQSHKVA